MPALQLLLPIAIAVLSAIGRFVPGGWLFGVYLLLTIAAIGAQATITRRATKSAAASKTERTIEINNILAPLVHALSSAGAAKGAADRRRAVVAFIVDATSACIGLTPAEKCRATFYSVELDEGARVFEPWHTTGRSDPPYSKFREDDDGEGHEVWRAAVAGEARFEPDTMTTTIPHFNHDRPRKYRTFITVPVKRSSEVVGLLTLNAPQPGDLTEEDVDSMRVIADLISTSVSFAGGKCPSRG